MYKLCVTAFLRGFLIVFPIHGRISDNVVSDVHCTPLCTNTRTYSSHICYMWTGVYVHMLM